MRPLAIAALLCACRSSTVTPDTAPLTEPAADPPPWFGTSGSRRIEGTLVDASGAPIAGTVHLRIAVPDPTIWRGMDLETHGDGRFSFTAPLAGRYTLFATAPGVTSRVVDVDVRATNAEVMVFLFACAPQWGKIVRLGGVGIANARIDVAGTIVAHTDEHGVFSVCASGQPLTAGIHAARFAAETMTFRNTSPDPFLRPQQVELERAIVIRGRIVDEAGRPVANIGLKPEFVDQSRMSRGRRNESLPLVTTSNFEGRFVFHELPEQDRATPNVAVYTAISLRGETIDDHRGASISADFDGELELMNDHGTLSELPGVIEIPVERWKMRGRVLRQGVPVPDAAILLARRNMGSHVAGYSRADGTFDVEIVDFGLDHPARLTAVDAFGHSRSFEYGEHDPDALVELP